MTTERKAAGRAERGDESIGKLSHDLYDEVSTLVERQIALARREALDALRVAAPGVGLVAVGAVAAQTGLFCLGLAAVEGLSRAMPRGAAATLVGLGLVGTGAAAAAGGVARLRGVSGAMPRTRETLAEGATETARAASQALGRG
jgi:hypothetical protein